MGRRRGGPPRKSPPFGPAPGRSRRARPVLGPFPDHLFPYAGTVAGAVLGATLIIFGRSLQRGLNSLAMCGDGLVSAPRSSRM